MKAPDLHPPQKPFFIFLVPGIRSVLSVEDRTRGLGESSQIYVPYVMFLRTVLIMGRFMDGALMCRFLPHKQRPDSEKRTQNPPSA
ncbi:hypothetical protein AVEN_73581-1 [Araneus ventricosus]|uniref:Uncharacterized protein n=1 Tax=Araneus ventricosus TaxID=182803 RepID=A0A4Y1ZTD0_ARAVE|nr:hypothetical protein AVEN_251117-1 [Araneus ventricosus]GBL67221.1 hypothetical protein AVEN_73581-1 [Araneus ventricosus]